MSPGWLSFDEVRILEAVIKVGLQVVPPPDSHVGLINQEIVVLHVHHNSSDS